MRTPAIVRIEPYHLMPEQRMLANEALPVAATSCKKRKQAAKGRFSVQNLICLNSLLSRAEEDGLR